MDASLTTASSNVIMTSLNGAMTSLNATMTSSSVLMTSLDDVMTSLNTTMMSFNATMTSTVTPAGTTAAFDVWTWYGATLVLVPLLMVVGLPGNILVLMVYTWRFPPSTFREFVRVLAVLDLGCNLVGMPLVLASAFANQHRNSPHLIRILASASRYVSYTTIFSSGFVLTVIAVDRYLKICRPQRAGLTVVRARLLCAIGVLVAFLINLPALFIDYDGEDTGVVAILHSALAAIFFVTFTVAMVTLYAMVWHRLHAHARSMRKSSRAGESESAVESAAQNALRTSKIFSAVTVLFFLTILPHFLLFVIISVDSSLWWGMTPTASVFADLANLSPFVNCVANPFVYSFTSPRFRKEFCRVMQSLRPGSRLSRQPTVTATCSDHAPAPKTGNWSSRETSEERLDAPVRLTAVSRLQARDACPSSASSSSSLAHPAEQRLLDLESP